MGSASYRSRRVMKYRIGKLGEELHIEIVGKHLPFDWSGPLFYPPRPDHS
jgi:hypothetical protein